MFQGLAVLVEILEQLGPLVGQGEIGVRTGGDQPQRLVDPAQGFAEIAAPLPALADQGEAVGGPGGILAGQLEFGHRFIVKALFQKSHAQRVPGFIIGPLDLLVDMPFELDHDFAQVLLDDRRLLLDLAVKRRLDGVQFLPDLGRQVGIEEVVER